MITAILLISLSFLAGYEVAPADRKDVIINHTIEVQVPCKAEVPAKPSMPLTDSGVVTSDIFVKTQQALAEIKLHEGYEDLLTTTLLGCKK